MVLAVQKHSSGNDIAGTVSFQGFFHLLYYDNCKKPTFTYYIQKAGVHRKMRSQVLCLKCFNNFLPEGLKVTRTGLGLWTCSSTALLWRVLDERVEKFLEKVEGKHIVLDLADFSLKESGIKEKYSPLVDALIMETVTTNRLAAWMEYYTGHNANFRRYYRQFEY